MKILISGLFNNTGYGKVAEFLYRTIKKLKKVKRLDIKVGYDINFIPSFSTSYSESEKYDIHFVIYHPSQWKEATVPNAEHHVYFVIWEFEQYPSIFLRSAENLILSNPKNSFFCVSKWNYDNFKKLIPEIKGFYYYPLVFFDIEKQSHIPDLNLEEMQAFLWDSVIQERKSYIETVYAFLTAFNDSSKCLILKGGVPFIEQKVILQQLMALKSRFLKNNAKILYFFEDLSESKMNYLYHNSKAFVLPTKAEGWGLPIIRAGFCKLPVITTYYSSVQEVIPAHCGYFVDYIEDYTFESFNKFYEFGTFKWARVSINSIVNKLKEVIYNYDEALKKAKDYYQFLKDDYFNTTKILNNTKEFLEKIIDGDQ